MLQLEIDLGELRELVTFAAKYAPQRPTNPVLGGIVIRAETEGTVAASVFDYEVSGQAAGAGTVTEGGQVIVSARKLAEIVTTLPKGGKGGKLVALSADETRLTVQCGTTVYTLPLMPLGEYPGLPELPPFAGKIGSDLLAGAIGQVATACSSDDTLPALTGILMEIAGDQMTLAGTDRYRLAVRTLTWQPEDPEAAVTVIVPAKVLLAATAALTTSAETSIWLDTAGDLQHPAAVIGLSGAGKQVTSRLIHAEYPRYRALLPSDCAATAIVPLEPLTAAVRRTGIAAERNTAVQLVFNGDKTITLTAGTGDDVTSTDQVNDVEFDGEDGWTVAYNPEYLGEGLAGVAADNPDRVVFKFTTEKKPAVLSAENAPAGAYRHVVMPIRTIK